jgi:hypothetical protein
LSVSGKGRAPKGSVGTASKGTVGTGVTLSMSEIAETRPLEIPVGSELREFKFETRGG